jgi:putative transposase
MRSTFGSRYADFEFQAMRFALDPHDKQRGVLASHAGGARYAYNLGLQWLIEALDQRKSGEAASTPNASEMHWRWNRWKRDPANGVSWWSNNSKCVYQEAFRDLEQAFNSFVASRRGKRKGKRAGFPRFKCKGRCRDRFRLSGFFRVGARWVQLPTLGRVRIYEDASKFVADLELSRAHITTASISRDAHRWYVNFRVVREKRSFRRRTNGDAIGVDVGINALATLSSGQVVSGPKALGVRLRKLRRLSKAHSRKLLNSRNRQRSTRRLARCYSRISSVRRDHLHKLSTYLAKNHGRIVIEDLSIQAMMSNRRLARSIADSGWGALSEMLEYKCRWYGSKLIKASRWFASSRTCSDCGLIKESLPLAIRVFVCSACGLTIDRDLNAAKNLARWPQVAGSAPETQNACRGNVRPGSRRADPDEAGTEQPIVASGSEPTAQAVAFTDGPNDRGEGRVASGI